MKQYGIRAGQSAEPICGADAARLKNDGERIAIPPKTIAVGRRHTVGLKSDGTVMAVLIISHIPWKYKNSATMI